MKHIRLATAAVSAAAVVTALSGCSSTSTNGAPHSSLLASSATPTATSRTASRAITDADVVGTWNNHRDLDIHQQIRFTADHEWHEDQHGTTNLYHGTWEITGPRTVMLHDWEEELRFSESNLRELTVVSFDHVLTKD